MEVHKTLGEPTSTIKTTNKRSQTVLELLRAYESRNVTFIDPHKSWPIVWERAHGVNGWDADGKKYMDLTAAFGVAAAGHANPRVVRAGQQQMGMLLHAMGDVHPHALKAQLAQELSRLTFERWSGVRTKERGQSSEFRAQQSGSKSQAFAGMTDAWPIRGKTIFGNSGFEAVEAALKTAILATGKPGVVAFQGAYHGLGYGALNVTHREHFRSPFLKQLREFARFMPFPRREGVEGQANQNSLDAFERQIRLRLRRQEIGAILVEPIQVRGGINIPPAGFLPLLRRVSSEYKVLLVLDEIYTGFGRTGKWFACEHPGVMPDLICLGKALTGGFPLSACVGCGLAAFERGGYPHQHLSGPSCRLCDGPRPNSRNRGSPVSAAERRARGVSACGSFNPRWSGFQSRLFSPRSGTARRS